VKITTPAINTKISTLADGSIKLEFVTPELPAEETAVLFSIRKSQGWLLFSENELNEQDIPKEQAEVGEKSPSARLRAVMHVYWEQQGRKGTFESFYRHNMERLIEQIKQNLE
jgi:hypothetical protein